MKSEFILSLIGGAVTTLVALAAGIFTIEQKALALIFFVVVANNCYAFLKDAKV